MKKRIWILFSTIICAFFLIAPLSVYADSETVFYGKYVQDRVDDTREKAFVAQHNLDENEYIDGIRYVQCGDDYYKDAPIEWYIIKDNGDSYILLSKYILANIEFTHHTTGSHFWNDSFLRDFLNTTFIERSFSSEEQKYLKTMTLSTMECTYEDVYIEQLDDPYQEITTEDKVFLLSEDETRNGTFDKSILKGVRSPWRIAEGETDGDWYLRGPCSWYYGNQKALIIGTDEDDGKQYFYEVFGTYERGVRPCICVKKNAPGLSVNYPGDIVPASISVKYNVKFNKNGGSGTMKSMKNLQYGKKYYLNANKFKRSGYVFTGWSTSKKGKVLYSDKASIRNLTSTDGKTVTLYAKWEKKTKKSKYKISYNANGGKGKMSASKGLVYGKTYKLKKNKFKRKGYTFIGWSKEKGGSVKYRDTQAVRNLTSKNKGNVKLYAVWVKNTNKTKIKTEKKKTPKVFACVISGCNLEEEGYTVDGATDMYSLLLDNKISGYTLKKQNIKLYIVNQRAPFKKDLEKYITTSFKQTSDNDISFVYYAGHGTGTETSYGLGISLMNDIGYYPYEDFLNLLDKNIKGKIILIVDACHSGGFAQAAKTSKLKNRICVLASSDRSELSNSQWISIMNDDVGGIIHDWINLKITNDKNAGTYQCFTYALTKGLQRYAYYPADLNKNGVVTCKELYAYIKSNINGAKNLPERAYQTPKCYLGKLGNQIIFGK